MAWVLVRDEFPGKRVVNALIDLPFALPTIVAGITLLALYGPNSPAGINVAARGRRSLLALLFVTLPFVVRVGAAGAARARPRDGGGRRVAGRLAATIFRRIILPNLVPAIVSGAALGFARAVGEFGSVVLISGNIPFHTQVSAVYVYGQVESDDDDERGRGLRRAAARLVAGRCSRRSARSGARCR